jgi:hypothetical protein
MDRSEQERQVKPNKKDFAKGSVFQKTYNDKKAGERRKTATWYLKYYIPGKRSPIEVSSGTHDHDEAVALLRQKMARLATQRGHSSDPDRVLVDQLLDLIIEDYSYQEHNSTYDLEKRINKHLRPFFAHRRAREVTTTILKRYVATRLPKAARGQRSIENYPICAGPSKLGISTSLSSLNIFRIFHCSKNSITSARASSLTNNIGRYATASPRMPGSRS